MVTHRIKSLGRCVQVVSGANEAYALAFACLGSPIQAFQAPHQIRPFVAAREALTAHRNQHHTAPTPQGLNAGDSRGAIRKLDISTFLSCYVALLFFLDEQFLISSASEGVHSLVEQHFPKFPSEFFFLVIDALDILYLVPLT